MEAPTWELRSIDLQTIFSSVKIIFICYIATCVILYILLVSQIVAPSIIPKGKRILIVTAHPDDECLFFAPAVTRMVRTNTLHILSTTSGDYNGKGATRKKEILESCQKLGVPKQNVDVFDDRSFLDGHDMPWDLGKLQEQLSTYIGRMQPDIILTFDEQGVSSHPNHIAVSKVLKQMFIQKKSPLSSIKLYKLETVPLIRKYLSWLDLPMSFMGGHLMFVSSFTDIKSSVHAMCKHRTQLVWYRVLIRTAVNILSIFCSVARLLSNGIELDCSYASAWYRFWDGNALHHAKRISAQYL